MFCYIRTLGKNVINWLAVKNVFSTYIWSKIDSCFCEFLYKNLPKNLLKSKSFEYTESLLYDRNVFTMDNLQHWKKQEIWNPFHKQNHAILKGFPSSESVDIYVHQFCKSKSTHFMCETVVKQISFFSFIYVLCGLYPHNKSWF